MNEWQEIVVRMLLDAGLEGVKYNHIVNKVDQYVKSYELGAFLESLRVEHAVQRFHDKGATYWRATELLPSVV